MAELPEEILRRSAEARAAADGVSVEEVLARWSGDAPPAAPVETVPADTPPAEAPPAAAARTCWQAPAVQAMSVEEYAKAAAAAAGMPEKLLMRSANAKAKAQGVPVEAILAEMAGLPAPGTAPAPAAPAAAPHRRRGAGTCCAGNVG